MFINGIGTAVPPQRYLKAECWEALRRSQAFQALSPRAQAIGQTVLQHDNGIEARHLALSSLEDAFLIDPDTLHARFVEHAPALASRAGRSAMQRSLLSALDIDAVIVSTCTGYLCPGLSGYVVEALGLRSDVQAFDLVGQGCAAALPNMRLAKSLVDAGHCQHVLSVCVEVCSAAMYLDDDPGVMISACLFGDGAGAAVLSRAPCAHLRRIEWKDAESLIDPTQRDALRFEQRGGLLRNVLTRPVPRLAATCAAQVFETVASRHHLNTSDIATWILHAGGRDVLLAVGQQLDVPADNFRYSAAMLREYGNLSSPFVYFVLQAALADKAPPGPWWLSSFGAGFSCHGALLEAG